MSPDSVEHQLSEVTRNEIIDSLGTEPGSWAGRLQEDQFLSRLYDLNGLPSRDYRYRTAAEDIWKHQVLNSDWASDWVFHDSRFNLRHAGDEEFLRFVCRTVHPTARSGADAARLVERWNQHLRRDGWELFQSGDISGRPVFAARRTSGPPEIFTEPTGWPKVDRQVDEIKLRLRDASTEEQFQSVGLVSREALISVAQAVYDRTLHPPLDGVEPSATDAKRMLDAYFAVALGGSGNDVARRHARAAFDLANGVQHDRAATFQDAALSAEAALSVIRIVAVLSGRRDRSDLET
jgi:AbiJ N-terminal domain 3